MVTLLSLRSTKQQAALTVSATIANTMTLELEHGIHVLTMLKNLGLKSLMQFTLLSQCLSPLAEAIITGQIQNLDDLKKLFKRGGLKVGQTPLFSPRKDVSGPKQISPTNGRLHLRDARHLFGDRIAEYYSSVGNNAQVPTPSMEVIPYIVKVESSIGELTIGHETRFFYNEEQVIVFCETYPKLLTVQYTGELAVFPYMRNSEVCFALVNQSRSGLEVELIGLKFESGWRIRKGDQLFLLAD